MYVAEVSRIGNLWERLVLVSHGWQINVQLPNWLTEMTGKSLGACGGIWLEDSATPLSQLLYLLYFHRYSTLSNSSYCILSYATLSISTSKKRTFRAICPLKKLPKRSFCAKLPPLLTLWSWKFSGVLYVFLLLKVFWQSSNQKLWFLWASATFQSTNKILPVTWLWHCGAAVPLRFTETGLSTSHKMLCLPRNCKMQF